ncbi:HAD family hydrolase [Phyllobacterium sp. YR531]|uniref:HAD family hydrolase n=1 Tax=Phyllobacterium sp. YR531 TaxID=1144343 RepID=UPI00026F63F7|nr:HAD family hydrolase [Phyllobacterium sp. YR531]EJN04503.1 haloacid dehalogenase superfamily protein, subfamily IA, variant 3 with third motif having DD or ED [Phyllobacterium sp. YR531]
MSAASAFDKNYAAFLFDMDGTILNSTVAAERVWSKWAEAQGLDVAAFMPTMHGVRAVDTIRRLGLPGVDPEVEAAKITEDEIKDVEGVMALPGAAAFLESLPPEKWAIVTSSPLELAKRRLAAAGIPVPRTLVTAEDVKIGKPNPDCYLLGARKLGVDATDCLVFEDATAGILAGDAAKADVMVITATHKHPVETSHATIPNYEKVALRIDQDGRLAIAKTA